MRVFALCLAVLLASPAAAQTSAAGTITTARAIVARMQLDGVMDKMFEQVMPLMTANVVNAMQQDSSAPSALKARLSRKEGREQVSAIVADEFLKAIRARYPEFSEGAAEEYRKAFSEDELKSVLAFYSSPVGAKLLAIQPRLQQTLSEQGRAIGRDAGVAAFPKIKARLDALDSATGK